MPEPTKTSAVITEARKRWARAAEAEDAQRKRMVLAKEFRAGKQWDDGVRMAREGAGQSAIQGQPPSPPRPCLTVDRLSQPCRQVSNTIKSANFAIDVLPNGHGSDTDTAQILKGYLRYVQNQARGESPIEWAADGAIESGLGWFRIRTDFVHQNLEGIPEDQWFHQEIRLERVTNNLTVYCDPWAVKPTRSDATYMFVTEDLSRDEFKRRYPNADMKGIEDLASTGDVPKGWIDTDNIRIAEYWRVEYEDKRVTSADGRTRTVRIPKVRGSKINAVEELPMEDGKPETWEWAGSRIPLVPIIGEELNVDGRPHLRGIIEEGMDAQRMVNYTYSGAMEIFALGPKSQFVVADDQLGEYDKIWQSANMVNYAYLPYKPVAVAGTLIAAPQRQTAEAPIQAAAMLMQVSEEAIKATTGIYDVSLGQQSERAKSGRAIQALQGQSDLGSSNYPDNVRRALIYAGELMMELIPKVILPGQLLQILGVDDTPEQVIVGQPFIQKQGQAVPIQESEKAQYEAGMVKLYDFTKGRYAVTVAVGKSYSTKREEGAAAIGELIGQLPPPMAAAVAPDYVEELSFPGAHKIAETMRRALPPELQPPKEGEDPIPPQAQQKIAQLEGMIRELEPLADKGRTDLMKAQMQAQESLQEKQIQEQAENERTLATLASKERLEMRKLEVELEIEMAKLGSAQSMARAELEQQELHRHSEQALRQQELQQQESQATLDREAAAQAQEATIGAQREQTAMKVANQPQQAG